MISYSLKVHAENPSRFIHELYQISDDHYGSDGMGDARVAIDLDGTDPGECCWWDSREKDMAELSRRHPDTLFAVYAIAADENWVEYYKGGFVARYYTEVTYPLLDPSHLREPKR